MKANLSNLPFFSRAPVLPRVPGATSIFQMCPKELSPVQSQEAWVPEISCNLASPGSTLFVFSWPLNNGEVRSANPVQWKTQAYPLTPQGSLVSWEVGSRTPVDTKTCICSSPFNEVAQNNTHRFSTEKILFWIQSWLNPQVRNPQILRANLYIS